MASDTTDFPIDRKNCRKPEDEGASCLVFVRAHNEHANMETQQNEQSTKAMGITCGAAMFLR